MASNLGTPGGQVPPAVRSSSPGWRDPRLWVGVAIIAASVLVGTRVLASADDTVQVWAVADDHEAGTALTSDDLVARRVRFAEAGDLERYLDVDDALPDDLTLQRGLGAGELLPRAAVGPASDDGTVTISLAVSPLLVPSAIGPGSVVNVYVSGDPSPTAGGASPVGTTDVVRRAGEPALSEVRVVAAPDGDGAGGDRQVELAVPADDVESYYSLVGGLTSPVVSLAQVS